MNNLFLMLILSISTLTVNAQKNAITTFILVRHTEKASNGTDDPDLKPEGIERATKLVVMLNETPVDAIYSSNFKPRKNTVLPLAASRSLTMPSYDAFKVEEIENRLKDHSGGKILISGHSNTIPWIANLLIGKEDFKNYGDGEYGSMLIFSGMEKEKLAKVTMHMY